jgi:hypothetical protein
MFQVAWIDSLPARNIALCGDHEAALSEISGLNRPQPLHPGIVEINGRRVRDL